MTIPERPTFESIDGRWLIRITDDGSPTLVERDSGDAMHSGCGARAETDHVYLTNSGLRSRLERGLPTRVLEVGLGSGLGCLMTMQLANDKKTLVEYVALEKLLTPADVIKQLKLEQQGIDASLIEGYCQLLSSEKFGQTLQGTLGPFGHLTICLGDAVQWTGSGQQPFDVIYFDPYSPDSNGELWGPSMLAKMKQVLAPEGRLVSYCVSRLVRDNLAEAGFAVERVPGPVGGKREVLIAHAVNGQGEERV
jgi:tRNA U34 5-methylaminomethyl-2-thiouridine-forming methyltransferase MnmC